MKLFPLSPRSTIVTIFLMHALANGGLFARIPDIQDRLGIDEGTLGLALLGQPLGAITMFLFGSRIIEAVGTRRVLMFGIPSMSLGVALLGVAPSAAALFAIFAVYGMVFAASNVSINVEADRVEAASGQRIMNTCHGVWSIGLLAASLLGTLARGLAVPVSIHLMAMLPVIVLGAVLVIVPMRESPPRAHSGATRQRRVLLPSLMTFPIVAFAISGALLEGATRNWSVIYMGDSFAAPGWVDTLTLPALLIAQSLGRLAADGWITRLGPTIVARLLMAVAFAGLALVVVAPGLGFALAGFLMIGLGVCVSFPLATSAAARLGDRPSSENVAAFTLVTQSTLLGTPALLGYIAATWGIRVTFAVILPMVILSFLVAPVLGRRAAAPAVEKVA